MICAHVRHPGKRLNARAALEVSQHELKILRRVAQHQRLDHRPQHHRLTRAGRACHHPVRPIPALRGLL